MIKPTKHIVNFDWIETTTLTGKERQTLMIQYDITDDILSYVTDEDETSNYVHDSDNNQQLLIALVPYQLDIKQLRYIARPIGFLIHNGTLFTFNNSNLNFITEAFLTVSKNPDVVTPTMFILKSLFSIMDSYIPIVRLITRQRNQLDKILNREAKNTNLLELSYLGQTLTFFTSAMQSNNSLFARIPRSHLGINAINNEKEALEDVTIEADQVAHMIENESRVVDRIVNTFDSIINNNMNDTMRLLTIWSLTMAIPTIVTGFYGMNMKLPLAGLHDSWIIVIVLSLSLIIWLLVTITFLKKK